MDRRKETEEEKGTSEIRETTVHRVTRETGPVRVDRGTEPRDFFTAEEQRRITDAVAAAEKATSGEIRVHLARKAGRSVYKAAVTVFERLGMHRTEARNGVLIFLALKEKQFAIIGDRGIDEKVPDGFWEETSRVMIGHFKRNDFAGGIAAGIASAGEKLAAFFPWQEDDVNELPDEISMEG